ncbi:galactitol-1-phosphate 5-dehydrogenase [Budvicia diplopodorum]|uniref:galactitol-1-phosphate 5-dehydrogenase n=1 Tax=Budvicia diplopodorum TaxID=1119056 RepID=UPI00135AE237|nr:galactitol-1-phosphate 5-dehydrogenase [Budvicia diplopodorum]
MKAVSIDSDGNAYVENKATPAIEKPDDVLVKVAYSGVCGSDIPRIFAKGAHFYPITLGHEFSGKVVETGSNVENVTPGDSVACVPLLPCFHCEECQRGFYSLCKQYSFVGSRSHGGNAEYIVVNSNNVFKLPQNVSLLQGAFFEPITVGLHALLLAEGCENKHVVVIGAGTIGLLAIQCAKAMGAASITAIDINTNKIDLALQLGATHGHNSLTEPCEDIQKQMHDRRFNQLILETAGTPQTIELAINIAGPKAQIALVGTLHHDLTLSQTTFGLILRKELKIIGSWMNYSQSWPGKEWQLAANFFSNQQINLSPLIADIENPEKFAEKMMALKGKPMNGKLLMQTED